MWVVSSGAQSPASAHLSHLSIHQGHQPSHLWFLATMNFCTKMAR